MRSLDEKEAVPRSSVEGHHVRCRKPFNVFAQQTEQQVFRFDRTTAKTARFISAKENDAARAFGIVLKHKRTSGNEVLYCITSKKKRVCPRTPGEYQTASRVRYRVLNQSGSDCLCRYWSLLHSD